MTKNIDFGIYDSYKDTIEKIVGAIKKLKQTSSENQTFLFFTDPHEFLFDAERAKEYDGTAYTLGLLKKCYDALASEFIVCGGDLLNNGDTKSSAIYKLSAFNHKLKELFEKPYFIIGNHDTNYQGDAHIRFRKWQDCILDQQTINSIFYDGGKSYYTFSTDVAAYYCLDSGLDWLDYETSDYQWEQIKWFANSLLTDKNLHKGIFVHMVFRSDDATPISMMEKIEQIVDAYNEKTIVTIDGVDYDYSNAVGRIGFIQAGHSHKDFVSATRGGVPIIVTTWITPILSPSGPSFDIVFADYSNSEIYCYRIGAGDDRRIKSDLIVRR